MPLNLLGPFNLDIDTINDEVSPSKIGYYTLENDNHEVKYVGRSDDDLNNRLKDWVDDYSYFNFFYADSVDQAFDAECRLYHEYGGSKQLDNRNHPDSPDNQDLQCPICSNR